MLCKTVTTSEASEAIASLKILSIFFKINDLQRCLVSYVSFYVDFASVVSCCSNRIIVSLFHMLLYVRLYSASSRIHPTFSYIMSFSYIRYMFTLRRLLARNGYLAENKVLPKKKSRTVRIRFVQVVCIFIYKQRVHRKNSKMHRDFFFTRL
jgi:hypothetical protein